MALVTELTEQADASKESNAKTSVYNPFVIIETSHQQAALEVQNRYAEIVPDESINGFLEDDDEDDAVVDVETITETVTSVKASIGELMGQSNPVLSDWWLKAAQTILLTSYCKSNSYSAVEEDLLLDMLASLQVDLTDKECLVLADAFVTLVKDDVSIPTDMYAHLDPLMAGILRALLMLNRQQSGSYLADKSLPLTAQLSSILLQISKSVNETHLWVQRCLEIYVGAQTTDDGLRLMYSQISCKNWSGYNWKQLFDACKYFTINDHMKMLHAIQTSYSIDPTTVIDAALKRNARNVLTLVTSQDSSPSKGFEVILEEIRSTNLLDESMLTRVGEIMTLVNAVLSIKNVEVDYEGMLNEYRSHVLTTMQTMPNEGLDSSFSSVLIFMTCACRKFKGWTLRKPQLVAIAILLLSARQLSNILLEVATGEGKSAILAIFATILAYQGKHVDIVTSSPILAQRDVDEWRDFYEYFSVTVDHNSYLNREGEQSANVIKDVYQKQVVYGTVGHFAADILRQEFEYETFRSDRRFDAVLVDEVDMLMLDEGVQFTYLSHNAAVFQHLEPVIAAVWGIVGPLRLTFTAAGQNLYAGGAKLVTQAIYECLDPEFSGVESHDQILGVAKTLRILTTSQYNVLLGDDQLAKKATMSELTLDHGLRIITGLQDYQNMPEFLAYKMNSQKVLEPITLVTDEDSAETLLLLEEGQACILNTLDKIVERVVAIVKDKLNFSDTETEGSIKLPKLMEDFILSQLSVYVKNALRALHMEQDREYTILDGKIVPVDFENSGVIELNKKWGGGLQQMLEMKHNISLSPITLVTNFMSNVEFFSRYKQNGGIYGMSGTLGLDEHSNMSTFLRDMYDTKVCSIPTFKTQKLIEKSPIFVDNEQQWLQQIVRTVNEESREATDWKGKRAALILCEDIKSARDLKKYVVETENWEEDKVHLYAHSSSKYLFSISREIGPGEVIIATNLAGRGTNIRVTDEVKANGGLFCLVTFLPRNRRVELQAFGRTARQGLPGSVRCILNYSTMPAQYSGLGMDDVRNMRAEEESIRLQQLMEYDVKEVQLREKAFKQYRVFLDEVYESARDRLDKKQIVSSVNEAWAMWLEASDDDIAMLREDTLLEALTWKTRLWKPANLLDAPAVIDLGDIWIETGRDARPPTPPYKDSRRTNSLMSSAANFYHIIQSGNRLYKSDDKEDLEDARKYYTKSIELEPRYSAIAYYNRAYVGIVAEIDDYKQKARDDIQAAVDSIDMYTAEVATVAQFAAIVRQNQEIKEGETEYAGEEDTVPDFETQTTARFEILRFVREQMTEALGKIDSAEGDIRAEPSDLFSQIPDADYATSLELARMHSLGLEIVYSIEEIPRFCWEGLVVFLLGVAQIVAGALLVAFTAGAASQFGMALIGEGISDCIDGIEGMVTGEFSWTEWAITKATGIALSLVTGGVSRLASTGLKAIKAGYKIAKTVRQLKAIPKIVSSTSKNAAKANMKTVAKYVGTEAVLQGVSYTTAKLMNLALQEVTKLVGQKLKESFMPVIRTAFSSGYLGDIVDGSFVVDLSSSYKYKSEVPSTMQERAKKLFRRIGDKVTMDLDSNSELKERLTTSSLSLFSQISQKSRELRGIANLAEAAIVITLVADTAASLSDLVDQFPQQMDTVSRQFVEDGTITLSTRNVATYKTYNCVIKFKNDLADQAGEIFASAVSTLLNGKLRPLVNQYQMTNKMGRFTNKVLGKYVLKSDRTMEEIKSMQYANYIRAVGFDTSGAGPISKTNVAKMYAQEIASSDTPGSLMELRIVADHYGQKVTIYTDKNGQLVKDSSIIPSVKKTSDEVELVFVPLRDGDSVGHYDVLIRGRRTKMQADQSNCLFHAYAYARNTRLAGDQLKTEADNLRKTVATSISENPGKFAEHISLRVKMNNLRRGNRFAMIGAGPPNAGTKVLDGFYKQTVVGDKVYTMYEQDNGVKCKAWRKYNKNLTTDSKGVVQEADARLTEFQTTMTGLNLASAAGKRCWDTKAVVGMIKRFLGNPKDTEVSYHLCPSRGGANAGDQYSNAIPASPHYNNLEKYIWSAPLKAVLGNHDFTMEVRGYAGAIDQEYKGKRDIDDATKALLSKRFALIEAIEPRAYRLQDPTTFTIHIPPSATVTQKDLDAIAEATHQKETDIGADTDLAARTITFYMPQDYELFVPTDLTNLQPNGELYPGELTKAKKKQKKLTIGKPPYYRSKPKGGKTAQDKMDFDDEFTKFAV